MEFDPSEHPHRRLNPLTQEYVLVSPHRAKRPWLGQVEPPQQPNLPEYDPACYLCPGNKRANGAENEDYSSTYSFPNDFAALNSVLVKPLETPEHPLLVSKAVSGRCDVVIFHPRHDLTLACLSASEITPIITEWKRLYAERSLEESIDYVQIFENKGAMMGCSNPHPHGQIWSMSDIPSLPYKELQSLSSYARSQSKDKSLDTPASNSSFPCLLCDYASHEAFNSNGARVVVKNELWIALVPYWATWPFEILLLPYQRHIHSILELTAEETESFANILSEVTIRFDNLFQCSFAYSMGFHQAPISLEGAEKKQTCLHEHKISHLHLHFYPPLLRSATVRKFLVGFELMSESQRDLTPEQGAERLRACSSTHYAKSS